MNFSKQSLLEPLAIGVAGIGLVTFWIIGLAWVIHGPWPPGVLESVGLAVFALSIVVVSTELLRILASYHGLFHYPELLKRCPACRKYIDGCDSNTCPSCTTLLVSPLKVVAYQAVRTIAGFSKVQRDGFKQICKMGAEKVGNDALREALTMLGKKLDLDTLRDAYCVVVSEFDEIPQEQNESSTPRVKDTVLLRCHDEYARIMELNPVAGHFVIRERNVAGTNDVEHCDGTFARLSGTYGSIYTFKGEIHLRIADQSLQLSDDVIVEVSGEPVEPKENAEPEPVRRMMIVSKNGIELFRHGYEVRPRDRFPFDFTACVDEEDFDFGLFVSNVSKSIQRKYVMLNRQDPYI